MTNTAFRIELDELTLRRARRGDMRACEDIYRLFQRPAYSLAYRICQCPDTAQEVIQEAFIVLFRRLDQFRGDAPFWAWLRRIVANQSISALRRRRPETSLESLVVEPAGEDQDRRLQNQMDIETALARLSPEDRSVVWLHDVEGYHHREIGQMMNKSESYSKSRLSRARKKLSCLTGEDKQPGELAGEAVYLQAKLT